MSQTVYGQFTIEGPAEPWTAEDEARLRGPRPHVLCAGAPYYLGAVEFTCGGTPCYACKQPKVSQRHCDGRAFCFGCGVLQ